MLSKTISMDIRPFGYAVVTNDGRVLMSNEGSLFIFRVLLVKKTRIESS